MKRNDKIYSKIRLKDPRFWFLKAYAYDSACTIIRKECSKIIYIEENPYLTINAVRSIPYLTAIASELFMKGYLIYKRVSYSEIRKLHHYLERIRKFCAKFGDSRFEEEELKFLTETCGEQLMENGGIRYPDKKDMVAYPEFKEALNILKAICGDVSETLPYNKLSIKGLHKNKYFEVKT